MRYRLFEYTVLPLGLCNAPITLQHLMNAVLSGCIDDFVHVYLDNITVYSTTANEHNVHLNKVFARLHENKLKAKLKKCKFGKPHVKYLGHVVGPVELRFDMDKVATVCDWAPPVPIKDVKWFLGFANHCNRFISNFAKITTPISNLSGKHEFVWGNEQ